MENLDIQAAFILARGDTWYTYAYYYVFTARLIKQRGDMAWQILTIKSNIDSEKRKDTYLEELGLPFFELRDLALPEFIFPFTKEHALILGIDYE